MRRLAAALLLLVAAAGSARAEQPRQFSAEGLAKVSDYIRNEVATGKIPGAILLIQQHGKPVYFENFGVRDIATELSMSADTIFRLYSMSKPITSVAAMMLVEDGKLALADPVSKYIPAFAGVKVGVEKRSDDGKVTLALEPAQAADHDRGPVTSYLGPHLRLLWVRYRARALCRGRFVQRRSRQCRIRRADRQTTAGGATGHEMGLRPFHRRAGPRDRGGVGTIAVPVREAAAS